MIYLLLIGLIVLAFLSYKFAGEDFFTPSTVQILSFAVTVFMCIYFMWSLGSPHEFMWETIGLIFTVMAISAVIGILVHRLFVSRVKLQSHTPQTVEISPIPNVISFLAVAGLLVTIGWLLSEIRRIGGGKGTFTEVMHEFRQLNSYSTEQSAQLPFLLRQLMSLCQMTILLYAFHLLRFWKELKIWEVALGLVVVGLCCLALLLNGLRTPVINAFIGFFIMFHLLRIQRQGGYEKYSFRSLALIGAGLLAVLAVFVVTKSLVGRNGRNEKLGSVDYIAFYTGSQYIALDEYLQDPPEPSEFFGEETFYNINKFLWTYHLSDREPYIGHKEFRPVAGEHVTNVYTFIREYHRDFGMAGVFVLHAIMMGLMSVFYEFVKKRRGNIGILLFSLVYYSVVMSFFDERFFSAIISVNHAKMALMLLVMYELFIRKRIRLDRLLKSAKAQ